MSEDKNEYPEDPQLGDVGHALVKGGISMVPITGGTAAEFLQLVLTPPLEKRRANWFNALNDRLNRLEQREHITPAQLSDNPAFIDAVLTATQAAVKTSNEDKIEALQNAIINSVLSEAPPPEIQQLYLSIVDSLSPWHLRLLYLFKDPPAWFERKDISFPNLTQGALHAVVLAAFPETKGIDLNSVWKDLYSRGLVNSENLGTSMTGDGLRASRTTELGTGVVNFTMNQL